MSNHGIDLSELTSSQRRQLVADVLEMEHPSRTIVINAPNGSDLEILRAVCEGLKKYRERGRLRQCSAAEQRLAETMKAFVAASESFIASAGKLQSSFGKE